MRAVQRLLIDRSGDYATGAQPLLGARGAERQSGPGEADDEEGAQRGREEGGKSEGLGIP